MDNASNCDTTATELKSVKLDIDLPRFKGLASRLRCMAHIINLVAKAFISIFFHRIKRKKAPAVKKAKKTQQRKKKKAGASATAVRTLAETEKEVDEETTVEAEFEEEEVPDTFIDIQTGDTCYPITQNDDLAVAEETASEAQLIEEAATGGSEVDPAQQAHDDAVVAGVVKDALAWALKEGIDVTWHAQQTAKGIFPKVAGIARKLHDNTTLNTDWVDIVEGLKKKEKISSNATQLVRRVATRWNSDHDCLRRHLEMKPAVESIIAQNRDLKIYQLTDDQWDLAGEVTAALEAFNALTKKFSEKEVPRVYDVVPLIEDLEHTMADIRDNKVEDVNWSPVVRVAAQASLYVIGKYYALTDDCPIYAISIALCPDRKMEWFKEHQWKPEDIENVKMSLIKLFDEHHATPTNNVPVAVPQNGPEASSFESSRQSAQTNAAFSKFHTAMKKRLQQAAEAPATLVDDIRSYLNEPLVPKATIAAAGGYLQYWYKIEMARRPKIAMFSLDYLSAPASSVDAERSFSTGRRQVNHLQHNISSEAFTAKMALGSWVNSPLMPSTSELTELLRPYTLKGRKPVKTAAK